MSMKSRACRVASLPLYSKLCKVHINVLMAIAESAGRLLCGRVEGPVQVGDAWHVNMFLHNL